MKTIIFVLAFIFSQTLFAGGISCKSQDGKRVVFTPQSQQQLAMKGFAMASAARDKKTDRRIVFYDDAGLDRTPPVFRQFSLHHECAHHALGHLLPGKPVSSALHSGEKEREADCYAKKKIESAGKDINIVYDTLRNPGLMKKLNANPNQCHIRVNQLKRCK